MHVPYAASGHAAQCAVMGSAMIAGRRPHPPAHPPIQWDLVAAVNAWRQMSAITMMRGSKRFTSKPGRETITPN
jgi:hypothetical protein